MATQDVGEPYSPYLKPIARRDDYVELESDGNTYKVEKYIVQPGVTESVTVSANNTQETELTNFQQNKYWLAQYRQLRTSEIPSGVTATWWESGAQNPLFTIKNGRGNYDDSTAGDTVEANLTELYLYENPKLNVTLDNTTSGPVTVDFRMSGFEYRLSNNPVNPPQDARVVYIPDGPITAP